MIIGDNGASAEGTPNGCFNEMADAERHGTLETPEFLKSKIDDFGGPDAYNHYAVGWAHAMDTPYQWTKQVASHWGGTRNGTIVHWPNGIKAKGEVRSQFHHVIDVAPTILEAAGLPHPTDRQQHPAGADRRLQHAVCVQRRQGGRAARDAVLRDVLQPRHLPQGLDGGDAARRAVGRRLQARASTRTCGSSTTPTPTGRRRSDLAKENPKKLAELQRLFLIEATKYSVLPLDDRTFERFNPDLAGRPQLIKGNTQILFGGMGRLTENSIVVDQEQVVLDHRRCRRAEVGRRGRHHRPGRQHQRLEPLREGRQAEVLLQLLRHRR